MHRDYVSEILAAKARGRKSDFHSQTKFHKLMELADEPNAARFLEYFPVAAVAALETVFRNSVQQLIDHGPPYTENAASLTKDLTIDWRILAAVHGHRISIGEFVGHLVRFSAFDDIQRAFTPLLGMNFFTAIKVIEERRPPSDPSMGSILGDDPGATFERVKLLIELRHQFAHEVPWPGPDVTIAELRGLIQGTAVFARALAEIVDQAIEPGPLLSQMELHERAIAALTAADEKLASVYNELLGKLDSEQRRALEESQSAWLEFRLRNARSVGADFGYGTIRPTMVTTTMEATTKQRTDELAERLRWFGS